MENNNSPFPIEKLENRIEELKYFTPSIEDIRIGYECENRLPTKGWLKTVIKESEAIYINSFIRDVKSGDLRTPYLIKEQIVAEGFPHNSSFLLADYSVEDGSNDLYTELFIKEVDGHELKIFRYDNWKGIKNYLRIMYDGDDNRFSGKCPSINEFRYITKLLGI